MKEQSMQESKDEIDNAQPYVILTTSVERSIIEIHTPLLHTNFSLNTTVDVPKPISKYKSQRNFQMIPHPDEVIQHKNKRAYVLYTSGCSGATNGKEIHKGFLKQKMQQNMYLCDYKETQKQSNKEILVTPEQENKQRIEYLIEELDKICPSIDITLDTIKLIAEKIFMNYHKFDAFVILCGFDVICYISTLLSFMFENLSKLVIFTGGYFPISYMRNDTVNNLIESFAIISLSDKFYDVIIISKNKGYRANRSIKIKEGDFDSVLSPNLEALVSVNIKIKFRSQLFLPLYKESFRIFTSISDRISILKFHILLSKSILEYQIHNPHVDGFILESYGPANLPQNAEILNIFKEAAENKGKIFLNIAQPVQKTNKSIMKDQLQKYHIYYGGDMTTQAAIAKLSYLLGKKYSLKQMKELIAKNIRGQLTQEKKENQFEVYENGFLELMNHSLRKYYPSNKYENFNLDIVNDIVNYMVTDATKESFEKIFQKNGKFDEKQSDFGIEICRIINSNNLLHRCVQEDNQKIFNYFINFPEILINKEDQNGCSVLYYALEKKQKITIQKLLKKGGLIICPFDLVMSMITKELLEDNVQFFQLLYHMQFRQTIHNIVNSEQRNVGHIAAILKAKSCLKYLEEKFQINFNQKDIYDNTVNDYLPRTRKYSDSEKLWIKNQ